MSKLDHGQLHLLRLIVHGANAEGWAPVSSTVWPLITAMPSDLVETRANATGGHARLTSDGDAVVRYS